MTSTVVGSVILATLSILSNQPSLLPSKRTVLPFRPTPTPSPPPLRIVNTLVQVNEPTSFSRTPDPTVHHLAQVVRDLVAKGSRSEAEKRIRRAAPARLSISGMEESTLDMVWEATVAAGNQVDEGRWKLLKDRIFKSNTTEFRLVKIEGGVIEMESTTMLLRLDLAQAQPQPAWLLSSKRIGTLPKFSSLFDAPLARGFLVPSSTSLLVTSWEINVPVISSFELKIKASGFLESSWRSELGLEDFKDEKIWTELEVESLDATGASLNGRYVLTDRGTTKSTYARAIQPSLFLAFSTNRFGPSEQDSFVFTTLLPPPYGHPLLQLATLDTTYRPIHPNATGTFQASISARWTPVEGIGIKQNSAKLSIIGSKPSFPSSLSPGIVCFPVFRVAHDDAAVSTNQWQQHPLEHAGRDSLKPIRWILPHLPTDRMDFEGSILVTSTPPVSSSWISGSIYRSELFSLLCSPAQHSPLHLSH